MATLWIREYAKVGYSAPGSAGAGALEVASEPGVDQDPVTFSTSAQSAAFAQGTTYIAMIASVAFHYVVGADPEATVGSLKVPADTLFFIGVSPGQKIAAVAAV